jgi:hypothetical protein
LPRVQGSQSSRSRALLLWGGVAVGLVAAAAAYTVVPGGEGTLLSGNIAYAARTEPAVFWTGRGDWRTNSGNITENHSLTTSPEAFIFFSSWGTWALNGTMDLAHWSVGFADVGNIASGQRAVGVGQSQYAGGSNNTAGGAKVYSQQGMIVLDADTSIRRQATLDDSPAPTNTQFQMSAVSNGDGDGDTDRRWHYVLIGGNKVNAKVVEWSMTTSTNTSVTSATQNVTTVGFEPNVCFHLAAGHDTVAADAIATDATLTMGVADYFDRQWSVMASVGQVANSTTPSSVGGYQDEASILSFRRHTDAALWKKVAHTAMLSNGFSVAISSPAASGTAHLSNATKVASLCLNGVNAYAGSFTKSTNTNLSVIQTNTFTTDTLQKFTPGVVILGSTMKPGVDSAFNITTKSQFMMGAASSTSSEQAMSIASENNDKDMETETYDSGDEQGMLFKENTFNVGTNSDDDYEALAGLSSFGNGTFALTYTRNDTQANTYMFLAMSTPYATAITLQSFDATEDSQGRLFKWRTGFESECLGFHIYEERNGQRRRLTSELIAGSSLMVGGNQQVSAGRNYQWQAGPNPRPGDKVQYFLEEVSLSGKPTVYGPYDPQVGPATGVAAVSSPLLLDLGRQGKSPDAGADRLGLREDLGPSAGRVRQPDGLYARPALKLQVSRDGLFRIGADKLLAAGLDPQVDPRRLRLYVDGYETHMRVTGEDDGRLDPGDALEFYGIGADTPFTDKRVYWLAAGDAGARRLELEAARPQRQSRVASFPYAVEDRPRSVYFTALMNEERENFFGPVIGDKPLERTLAVHHVAPGAAELRVRLQGVSEQAHAVTVSVNGRAVGSMTLDQRANQENVFSLPAGLLTEGDNVIALVSGTAEDVLMLDRLRLSYPHRPVADQDAQRVVLPPGRGIQLDGFTTAQVRAFDVSHPDAVVEVPLTVTPGEYGHAAAISARPQGGTVLFVADRRLKDDLTLVPNRPSDWSHEPAGADMLIITHGSLAAEVEPLRRLREQQGLTVKVVDVEDIYDELTLGQKDPGAIRAFLQMAASRFPRRPRYVLLVGDASFDSRDYLGLGDHDLVPTRLVDTWPLETASDDWFADLYDQGLPDMAIGRIPARTPAAARAIVDKIVNYNRVGPSTALILSDLNTAGGNFSKAAQRAADALPAEVGASLRLRGVAPGPTDPPTVFDALNAGPLLVEYFGHGSVDLWNGMLDADAASKLTNHDRLSLVVSLTCLNGFFQDARQTSMAEALLGAPQGGAVAVWASSGFTVFDNQKVLGDSFVRGVLQEGLTLGDAARRAKATITDLDIRRSWILFGDPSQSLTQFSKAQGQGDGATPLACSVSHDQDGFFAVVVFAAAGVLLRRRRRRR